MTERPDAQDYRNRGERDAAYWRELCERLVNAKPLMEEPMSAPWHDYREKAIDEAKAELARINAEALR